MISAMPEMRADLFLAISKTDMCLLTSSFLNVYLFWFPAGLGLKKVGFNIFLKFRMILSKRVIKTFLF